MGVQRDDDEAWRAIVENYGDRAQLGPEDDAALAEPRVVDPRTHDDEDDGHDDDRSSLREDPEDAFVPPPPPPIPRPTNDRLAAWLGVFGAPALLIVCTVAGVRLGSLLTLGLVAAFIGGFLYLVFRMPREPRDPFDDGARL